MSKLEQAMQDSRNAIQAMQGAETRLRRGVSELDLMTRAKNRIEFDVFLNKSDFELLEHIKQENDATIQSIIEFAVSEYYEYLKYNLSNTSAPIYKPLSKFGAVAISKELETVLGCIIEKTGLLSIDIITLSALEFIDTYRENGVIYQRDKAEILHTNTKE